MKKILIILMMFAGAPCFAMTSEVFSGMDTNALKAGISKYILTKGGKIYHGEGYDSNTFQAVEQATKGYNSITYNYIFNLVPVSTGTRLELTVLQSVGGSKPAPVDSASEQKIMQSIMNSTKGRFLYGLGFDFDYYNSDTGKIKAPKGKNTGIVITAVKYDAYKKGLQEGDVITEINGIPTKDIPLAEFATILNAKSLTDTLTITYKRKNEINTVTLIPRLSNIKTF